MKYDILQFIDSDTLREMLRGKQLEPAIECILISRSRKQPMEDKLAAFLERWQAFSAADFQEGVFHLPDTDDFKKALGIYMEKMLQAMVPPAQADADHIFQTSPGFIAQENVFRNFSDAVYDIRYRNFENKCIIRRAVDSSGAQPVFYELNDNYEISSVEILSYDDDDWNIENSFAELPHEYQVGDIVQYQDEYFVIANISRATKETRWLDFADSGDMSLYCFAYCPNKLHSCGGTYGHAHIPILQAERIAPDDLPDDMKPLLALSLMLKGEMKITDFLESYSNGMLPDLMQYYERKKT